MGSGSRAARNRAGRFGVVSVCALLGAVALVIAVGYGHMLAPVAAGSTRDSFGRPAAWDFRAFYSAAHFSAQGRPAAVYDEHAMADYQRELFGDDTPSIPWPYPPSTALVLRPLGELGYSHALLLWLGLGLCALALAAVVATRRPSVVVLALLAPSVSYALAVGQISVFVTALLLAGLALLRPAPLWAGALLGLLVLKPQLAIFVPVLLLAWRDRRVLLAASGSALALLLASLLVFGGQPWLAFMDALPHHGADLFARPRPELWVRVPTTYVLLRQLGASVTVAWCAHASVAVAALGWLWRGLRISDLEDGRRALLLVSATLLGVPYVWDYDLVILVVPALLIWRDRGSGERLMLGVVLFMMASLGLAQRYLAGSLGLPVGPLLWAMLLAWASSSRPWSTIGRGGALTIRP